jgi:aldose 1-epimerase
LTTCGNSRSLAAHFWRMALPYSGRATETQMPKIQSDTSQPFGILDERLARIYTLENEHLRVRITDYGGILVSVEAPDRDGRRDHVVLGFDDLDTYVRSGGSFGAMIGRYANRIAGGRFKIDDTLYETSRNDHGSTLHGGEVGFGKRFWTVDIATKDRLKLSLVSADGDQGFPGRLSVATTYHLSGCELGLDLVAHTTKATPVSLSTHPYFNLEVSSATDCLAHLVTIAAADFLETDKYQIPTGERKPVVGTAFDFTAPRAVGDRIRELDVQLQHGCGYDHFFVLTGSGTGQVLRPAVRVADHRSGRILEVLTTQRGVQFYTGNQLNGNARGRNGLYRQSAGLAIEPTAFPNAVNQSNFPPAILRPEQVYRQSTIYRFLTDETR